MAFWRRNDAKRVAYGRIRIAMRNYTLHAKLKEFFFENFECQNLMSLVVLHTHAKLEEVMRK